MITIWGGLTCPGFACPLVDLRNDLRRHGKTGFKPGLKFVAFHLLLTTFQGPFEGSDVPFRLGLELGSG